ncbi:hypothetical protein [Jeotgalibacillus sp. R-1-5s-1]|uniref:hypothetical protein n=1 Tax=Jeotgalibacillus sp. R-1-5s-1 TaxID=2555897 RepID=UPI00106D0BED|nr:hypothetical protein [Jeotgalibacillus sp. R-1-5s-1]TFD97685.1 hypothetical protein E2491_09710 [Jeotgalibacillus sp. R-1-5s-1]
MDDRVVYFISSNHERSSIAEGWASRLYIPNTIFKSAGWADARKSTLTLEAMKEINIDITDIHPSIIDWHDLQQADLIVLIQDEETDERINLEPSISQKVITWNVINPEKRAADPVTRWVLFQEICDDIALRIRDLEQHLSAHAV